MIPGVAEIGYVSPSGARRYYDAFGARCSGAGFTKPLHEALWMEYDRALIEGFLARANGNVTLTMDGRIIKLDFAPRVEYSRAFTFATLAEFRAHVENL
jgi:hypothetical protein